MLNKTKSLKLFDRPFMAGETVFMTHHRNPLLRPWGVDRWIVNLTLSGHARINRGQYEFRVQRGDLLLFPPSVIHDYSAVEGDDWVHLWCYFEPRTEWVRLLQWPEASLGVKRLISGEDDFTAKLESIFYKLLNLHQTQGERGLGFCLNTLEELLLWTDTLNPESHLICNERLERCLAFIAANIRHQLRLADLAAYCHMSPSRFAHWFRETQGTAPMRYLELVRMEKAQELISCTGMNISEVAEQIGYTDPLYFSRVFQHHYGVSPRRFRQRLEYGDEVIKN